MATRDVVTTGISRLTMKTMTAILAALGQRRARRMGRSVSSLRACHEGKMPAMEVLEGLGAGFIVDVGPVFFLARLLGSGCDLGVV